MSKRARSPGPVDTGIGGPASVLHRRGLVLAAAALGALSCRRGGRGPRRPRVGFGHPDRKTDIYKPLVAGAKEEAAARGYQLLESFADSKALKQVAEFDIWIAQKVEAITTLPLDEKAIGGLIHKAQVAGTKVVSYAQRIPGADGYTVFDEEQGAKLIANAAARWVNETQGGEAEVALLTAEFHDGGRRRIHGAEAALLAAAPRVKIVARSEAVLAADALKAVQSMLQAHPRISVILCIADDGCLGAAQAFASTGRPDDGIFIAGWDGSRQAMQRILDGGPIKATAALDLKAVGRSAVWVPANILEKKQPTFAVNRYLLITKDTPAEARRLIAAYG